MSSSYQKDTGNWSLLASNKAFAEVIVEEAEFSQRPPVIIVNDYHLYLAGGCVKEKLPDMPVQYFIHIT